MSYGSIEQTKRRRKKNGKMHLHVHCGCPGINFTDCEHNEEWRQRNIDLLRIRKPLSGRTLNSEIVQRVAAR